MNDGSSNSPNSRRGNVEPQATAKDVDIILRLYELRRDPEMRKARDFISAEFWPEKADDVLQLARAFPSPENTWLRQVTSYWEMAAAFVLRGGLHPGLFFDCSGEMYCVFAKFVPFLEEVRRKLPYFLLGVEKVIMCTQEGRDRLERLKKRLARRKQKQAERCASIAATSAGFG